jgi:transposase-like protein
MEVAVSRRRQAGRTVDFLLTHRRNAKAARHFLAKALRTRQHWPPQVINTDKNPAYGEALRQLKRDDPNAATIEHRQAKYLNNRIEADHGPIKRLCRASGTDAIIVTSPRYTVCQLP